MALWKRKGKTLVILMAALAIGAAACGDEDTDGQGGDLTTGDAGQISAAPITFQQVSIGEEAVESVDIFNRGGGPLRISEITLHEEAGGDYDGDREFTRGEGWSDDSLTIASGERHTLSVKYLPLNQVKDAGRIVVKSNDPDRPELSINISTPDLAPDLFSPKTISFGRVSDEGEGEPSFRISSVQNIGAAPLEIDDVYVSGSDQFWVTFPQPTEEELENNAVPNPENDSDEWPGVLEPEAQFPVRIWFQPQDDLAETGELVFDSNDADEPQYVVNLSANSGEACLRVHPGNEIAFGQASIGQTSQKTVTLENCSRSTDLNLSGISITDDAGGVFKIQDGTLPGELPDAETVLAPGERTNFVVTFEPTTEEQYEGQLTIESDDGASSTMEIPVVGRGSDNECPTARARAWVQGSGRQLTTIETVPLNTIMFDGSGSSDNGSVERYEWTILSRPQGSTQRLMPNNASATPRLFLDLAGTYEVELKVYDDEGAASCGTAAKITIIAVPKDDVHVQLVWDTPSDPDQTDSFGSDLDLHYLHPNGRWNDTPWDIFWRNPEANWGDQNTDLDDPSLDIDDTDGAGPENINHSNLENLPYKAGVYYYSDSTLGASYATLRVYVRGSLAMELENKYMPRTGSFWDAVVIEWPSANVTNISRMYDGFP